MASGKVENQLVELERQYWQALKDNDVAVVERLTDDPCIVTGAQGVGKLDRKSLVQMMKDATYSLDSFELDPDVHVRMLDDDVAILTVPTPEEFAGGILAALADPDRAAAIGRRAGLLAETKYSYEAYLSRTREAVSRLGAPVAPAPATRGAA